MLFGMVLRSDNTELKKMKMKNITKWLGASVVFGLLSLATTQRAHATTIGPLEMSYTSNSPYLLGTVLPGLQGNGGQAARDAAMTNTLLGMGFHTQARIPFPNGPLYSRTTLPGNGPATTTGAVLGTGFGEGTTPSTSDLAQTGHHECAVVADDRPEP